MKAIGLSKVRALDDFAWSSRLRYYGENETVELRMMHSRVEYGYEYLSPFSKLVMTPLTERCYQILLMALDLFRVIKRHGI